MERACTIRYLARRNGGRCIRRVVPSGWNDVFGEYMVSVYHRLALRPSSLHSRGIFHDEAVYPDSHAFNPDRFLAKDGKIDPSVPDPENRVFGSGRRFV